MEVKAMSLADIKPGMWVYYHTRFDRAEVTSFAELVGDISPLHVNVEYGVRTPYGGNLVHGMLVASHFSTIIGVLLPGRAALLTDMSVSFVRPIPVGTDIVISGKVERVAHAVSTIEVSLRAYDGHSLCVRATAGVRVRNDVQVPPTKQTA